MSTTNWVFKCKKFMLPTSSVLLEINTYKYIFAQKKKQETSNQIAQPKHFTSNN